MKAKFNIVLVGDEMNDWLEYVRIVDGAGFWGLGIGDSQSLYQEVYVRCTMAAMQTRNVRLGPWVTNPLTRHPAVTASAIVSVDQVSGGRAYLGVGGGDSAVLNAGLRQAKMAFLDDYVRVVKALLAKGHAEWNGQRINLTFARRRVPVYVAASGPKTARLVGRMGDGAVFAMGITPEVTQDALAQLRAGAEEAGRDMQEIDVWWAVQSNLAEDDATALNELKASLITRAHHAFRFTTKGKHLPPEYEAAMQRIQQEYQPLQHATFGAPAHVRLADELDVTPYLARRFAICGSPETFIRRVEEAHAAGAKQLSLHVRVADKRRFLRLWNERVRPYFS
ncbi:MAG: LLM class flavin-dependent oxidoreductase [Chloroflexi bacterium]|nr:LLM class flavin-dependent oxidoreductase [Chloroflexota bacterium]